MPRSSPYRLDLSPEEATELHRRAASYTLPLLANLDRISRLALDDPGLVGRLAQAN